MRIDPQRLIRLAVLIQHGSFRRAAEQLCVTQPALSQSISQIEREVGVKLIERTPHGIEPTAYGRVLYERAKAIDRELAQAAQEIHELAVGHQGALMIGTIAGGASSLITLAVCKLLASRPGVDMRIIEDPSVESLLTQLHDRRFDLLICQRPQELQLKGARAISLFCARRVICVRSGHPLASNITLQDLVQYPFVCPEDEMGMLFGFRQIFSTSGLELPEVLVSNSIHIAKDIVLNSDAFALFSDLSIIEERRLGRLLAAELSMPTQYWMQLIVRSEQSATPLMKAFMVEVHAVCAALGIDAHPDAADFHQSSQAHRSRAKLGA